MHIFLSTFRLTGGLRPSKNELTGGAEFASSPPGSTLGEVVLIGGSTALFRSGEASSRSARGKATASAAPWSQTRSDVVNMFGPKRTDQGNDCHDAPFAVKMSIPIFSLVLLSLYNTSERT